MASGQGPGMFPLLRLLTGQAPQLVEHAEAYAELAAEELSVAAAHTRRRVVAFAVCAFTGLLAVVFGGIALMLWGALPAEADAPARWLLWFVPLVLAAAAIGAAAYAHSHPTQPVFPELRLQWKQDMALLREGLSR